MKCILYTVALNKTKELVTANEAEKGEDFTCATCDSVLILKKSGKSGPGSKRPHFAHKALNPNCTPETALHFGFKTLLAELLQQKINESSCITISWQCEYCSENHSGNLLKKVKSISLEHNMGLCRPDIALFDSDGNVFGVIEVVVTHKPEQSVLAHYHSQGIICIQLTLTSDEDIYRIEEIISWPSRVHTCFNPRCKVCHNFTAKRTMIIVKGWCWNCGDDMKVAAIQIPGSTLGPEEFTTEEVKLARSKGVVLQHNRIKISNHLVNYCPECQKSTWTQYLFKDFIAPASRNEFASESITIGYFCEHCEGKRHQN